LKPTVHFDTDDTSADAFFDRYGRAASALQACGIGERDVFAMMLRNEPVALELMLAGRWLGARWCMVNWHFKAHEVKHILSDSGAKILIVHADLLEAMHDGIPAGVKVFVVTPQAHTRRAFALGDGPWPLAQGLDTWEAFRDGAERVPVAQKVPGSAMLYTSGTTGLPKGIQRNPASPEQVQATVQMSRIALGAEPGMRALLSAPLYHSAPMSYAVLASLSDAALWIEPRFDAERTLQLIERHRLTHAYLVATMFVRLLALPPEVRSRYDLSSIRFVASTGSPCAPEVKRQMIEWWGPVIHEAYAASELGYITHIDSHEALRKPGSAGRALPGAVLKVLSDDGDTLPAGSVGVLYARHAATPDFTYSHNDAARRKLETGGLWTLGDMGYLDADGYLFIVDRQSDMVISGGVNIYPAEIEAVLITMPGVADCALFGVPDAEFGECLVAAVQTVAGVTLTTPQVQAFLRERIAGYKVPRQVTFHEALPREDSGKIFKRKLRDPYWVGVGRRV
jgi:long-chain acyl-CoA synthetase